MWHPTDQAANHEAVAVSQPLVPFEDAPNSSNNLDNLDGCEFNNQDEDCSRALVIPDHPPAEASEARQLINSDPRTVHVVPYSELIQRLSEIRFANLTPETGIDSDWSLMSEFMPSIVCVSDTSSSLDLEN